MSEERLTAIIEQCKANNVDTRIDALSKLQLELESSDELMHADALIPILKTCLRTSNVQLSTAAVLAIHAFISHIERQTHAAMDLSLLRQLVSAFLPSGGVIDRLGEQREKTRDKSHDLLFKLGGMCLKANPSSQLPPPRPKEALKAVETPLLMFERFLKDVGLGSKVWRVREQAILVVTDLRRVLHTFPLRPFLPSLVHMLQDSDGSVRECARKSVVSIFSATSVTDAARADLKKEMEKQGVRKNAVDEILASVIGKHEASSISSSIPESEPQIRRSKTEPTPVVVPPLDDQSSSQDLGDLTGRQAEVVQTTPTAIHPVYIASSRDLENEFTRMLVFFEGKETEHNWASREQAIQRLRGMIKGDVHKRYGDAFFTGLKNGLMEATIKTLLSLRTSLATGTMAWYTEYVQAVGTTADPFVELILTHLLRMAGYTKKIVATQSQATVTAILKETSAPPRIVIPLLANCVQEKTPQARQFAARHIKSFLDIHGRKNKHAIEASNSLDSLEKCLQKGLTDASKDVRETSRPSFWTFYEIWDDHAGNIVAKLDVTARKELERACPFPDPPALAGVQPKKTSLAAQIAASKAKAKQIAVAPPSLRHQATSTSQISTAKPIIVKRVTSPASSPRASQVATSQGSPLQASRQRRTPSTTTLPTSSDGSARGSPSPPPIRGTFQPIHSSRIPSPTGRTARPTLNQQKHRSISGQPGTSQVKTVSPSVSGMLSTSRDTPTSPTSSSPEQKHLSDTSFNLMSFSTPTKIPPSDPSLTLPHGSLQEPDPAIEEELRATSAQAEAAAEQLLDLSMAARESIDLPIPIATSQDSMKSSFAGHAQTPMRNGNSSQIWAQVQEFRDSPPPSRKPLVSSVLHDQRHHSNWWLKTKSMFDHIEVPHLGSDRQSEELLHCISALNHLEADVSEIGTLIAICRSNPSVGDPQPSVHTRSNADEYETSGDVTPNNPLWQGGEVFERLLGALLHFLTLEKNSRRLQAALVLLWELVECQLAQFNGHELRVYQALFTLRWIADKNILEATNAVRDAFGAQIDPLYGLTTLHSCLTQVLRDPLLPGQSVSSKTGSHVFGLNGLGKFVLRLPSEVLEEELPRMRNTILTSLAHANSVVRSAASMVVVASQIVLGDQAHLFALLDGLSEEKKNFLTYMFEKNGVRASGEYNSDQVTSLRKVELEMDKLDERLDPR